MGSLRSIRCQGARNRFKFHDGGFFWHEGPHRFHLFYGVYGQKIYLEARIRLTEYYDLGNTAWCINREGADHLLKVMSRGLTTSELPWYEILNYPKKWGRFEKSWRKLLGVPRGKS